MGYENTTVSRGTAADNLQLRVHHQTVRVFICAQWLHALS